MFLDLICTPSEIEISTRAGSTIAARSTAAHVPEPYLRRRRRRCGEWGSETCDCDRKSFYSLSPNRRRPVRITWSERVALTVFKKFEYYFRRQRGASGRGTNWRESRARGMNRIRSGMGKCAFRSTFGNVTHLRCVALRYTHAMCVILMCFDEDETSYAQ